MELQNAKVLAVQLDKWIKTEIKNVYMETMEEG